MTLAIFDLDNTLLAGDSDHAWGDFLVAQGEVDGEAYRRANDEFLRAYQAGTLDIRDYLAFALRPLAETPPQRLERLRQVFIEERVRPMLLPRGQALVDSHRDAGDRLLIITATNRFVTEPIAALLGIEHLIATEPEMRDGRYTGRVAGTPSFQEGKIQRLEEWREQQGVPLQGAWFYSDSRNDLPLLERVDNPVAVDPDEHLRQVAQSRDWPILSLRQE